jgi:hypothetical protein
MRRSAGSQGGLAKSLGGKNGGAKNGGAKNGGAKNGGGKNGGAKNGAKALRSRSVALEEKAENTEVESRSSSVSIEATGMAKGATAMLAQSQAAKEAHLQTQRDNEERERLEAQRIREEIERRESWQQQAAEAQQIKIISQPPSPGPDVSFQPSPRVSPPRLTSPIMGVFTEDELHRAAEVLGSPIGPVLEEPQPEPAPEKESPTPSASPPKFPPGWIPPTYSIKAAKLVVDQMEEAPEKVDSTMDFLLDDPLNIGWLRISGGVRVRSAFTLQEIYHFDTPLPESFREVLDNLHHCHGIMKSAYNRVNELEAKLAKSVAAKKRSKEDEEEKEEEKPPERPTQGAKGCSNLFQIGKPVDEYEKNQEIEIPGTGSFRMKKGDADQALFDAAHPSVFPSSELTGPTRLRLHFTAEIPASDPQPTPEPIWKGIGANHPPPVKRNSKKKKQTTQKKK